MTEIFEKFNINMTGIQKWRDQFLLQTQGLGLNKLVYWLDSQHSRKQTKIPRKNLLSKKGTINLN